MKYAHIATPTDTNNQICCAIGFGISLDLPIRYTPIPKDKTAIPVANGKIQAPNIADSGIIIKISSNGVNNPNPNIKNIDPIIRCLI